MANSTSEEKIKKKKTQKTFFLKKKVNREVSLIETRYDKHSLIQC
jgi:hypothetical protein